jgi:hypothetical protein
MPAPGFPHASQMNRASMSDSRIVDRSLPRRIDAPRIGQPQITGIQN